MLAVPCILACVHLARSLIRFGVLVSKNNLASPGQNAAYLRADVNTCVKVHMSGNCALQDGLAGKSFGVKVLCTTQHYIAHLTSHAAHKNTYCHGIACDVHFAGCAELNLHVLCSSSSISYTWDEAPI